MTNLIFFYVHIWKYGDFDNNIANIVRTGHGWHIIVCRVGQFICDLHYGISHISCVVVLNKALASSFNCALRIYKKYLRYASIEKVSMKYTWILCGEGFV